VRDRLEPGRFGPVYRAVGGHPTVDAIIKVFDQGLTPEQARLLADALARLCQAPLDHPSIVSPLEAGVEDDLAWLAEPWMDGTPLDRVLAEGGPQPLVDALPRITQVAAALDFAVATGICHGSLHPRDILFAADRAMVTGVGVLQSLSKAGLDVPMNEPTASPQRTLGLPVGPADDIYTLAAITIEILYGRPLAAKTKLSAIVRPLPGVDHEKLRDVLEGSLAEDPGDRPSTALEFAGALQQAIVAPAVAVPMPVSVAEPPLVHADAESHVAPLPAPMIVDDSADLPLRATEPHVKELELGPDLEPPQRVPVPSSILANRHPDFEPPPQGVRVSWFGVAVGLAIGLLAGFAGGFIVGQRDHTPVPTTASRAIPRAQREAQREASRPTPTSGQDYSESTIPPARVIEQDVKPTDRPQAAQTESTEPAEPAGAAAAGPARVEVVSRPSGAEVFLDGRLVGRTPLMLSEVPSGAHAVRIALPGHQRWVTTVEVAPGSHQRVAASLER
jgi:serine/threonine protein kinase